jgi:hypothetical protein
MLLSKSFRSARIGSNHRNHYSLVRYNMEEEKVEPKSVHIGVDPVTVTMNLSGEAGVEEPTALICPHCGNRNAFQIATRMDTEEAWVFCLRCGNPVIAADKVVVG